MPTAASPPLPSLALTVGDPAGVGPEVIAGCWPSGELHGVSRPLVVGHPEIMRRAVALLGLNVQVIEVGSPAEAHPSAGVMPCLRTGPESALDVSPATVDARSGEAAYQALQRGIDLALAGKVSGIVTAPLNKAALWAAGHHYPGHTELLAERCGVDDYAMMLYLGPDPSLRGAAGLGVIHVTLHVALADVFARLSPAAILEKIHLASRSLEPLVGGPPRLGVCALNPHAGESGLFGREEIETIAPAVAEAQRAGLNVAGPFPADALLVRARDGEFDGVVAMYHDQGHIALKLLGMHRAVNITLGLPIVRTSVAHGTAFDRAWQGRAETSSMIEAVRVAAHLARAEQPSGRGS